MENELVKLEEVGQPNWLTNMNWDEFEKFASIGYSPENIAMYYKINKLEFMYYFMMIESDLEYHYKRGILVKQADEGLIMLKDASKNITQAQRLDKLREKIEFMNARDEIVYGGF